MRNSVPCCGTSFLAELVICSYRFKDSAPAAKPITNTVTTINRAFVWLLVLVSIFTSPRGQLRFPAHRHAWARDNRTYRRRRLALLAGGPRDRLPAGPRPKTTSPRPSTAAIQPSPESVALRSTATRWPMIHRAISMERFQYPAQSSREALERNPRPGSPAQPRQQRQGSRVAMRTT